MPINTRLATTLAALVWVSALGAQDLDQAFHQGLSAYERGDGLLAGEFWEPCAVAGHADCQYGLGVLFDNGAPEWPSDTAKAIRWLVQAARQKHANAQIRLGFLYAIGRDDLHI